MIMLVKLKANRLSPNSRNSSQPPSTDRFAKGDKADKIGLLVLTVGKCSTLNSTQSYWRKPNTNARHRPNLKGQNDEGASSAY
jgi:hypothetical protein